MHEIIEQLYKECGIEKILDCSRPKDITCGYVRPDLESVAGKGCFECEYINDYYPPFTAEKQIKLLQLLGSVNGVIIEDNFIGYYPFIDCGECDIHYINYEQKIIYGSKNPFDVVLAKLTLKLISNKELEIESVREILQ